MRSGPAIDPELLAALPAEPRDEPFMDGHAGVEALRVAMAAYLEDPVAVAAATGVDVREEAVAGVTCLVIDPIPDVDGPRPFVVGVHGGGMVAGRHTSGVTGNVAVARQLGVVMVMPDYRLAPEHRYPAALDDVTAVWTTLHAEADDRRLDPARAVLSGGSAGGGLAASLALRIRDDRLPRPLALLLVQPMLDDRNVWPSTYELDHEHFWDRSSNRFAWDAYLGGADRTRAVPGRATDLSGLPPTFLEIGQVDVFRDEVLDFAARLSRAGVTVEAHLWAGAFHGFDGVPAAVSERAVRARREFLEHALRT